MIAVKSVNSIESPPLLGEIWVSAGNDYNIFGFGTMPLRKLEKFLSVGDILAKRERCPEGIKLPFGVKR